MPGKADTGKIHIYTGSGKGKTTAMLGLALRAAGAGKKVYIAQFLKHGDYGEIRMLREKFFDSITIEQFGLPDFDMDGEKNIAAAQQGINHTLHAMASGKYDVFMLDEICMALHLGYAGMHHAVELIKCKPEGAELVLTGRYAPQELLPYADLVTEMRKIKHYYDDGISAREGIEL